MTEPIVVWEGSSKAFRNDDMSSYKKRYRAVYTGWTVVFEIKKTIDAMGQPVWEITDSVPVEYLNQAALTFINLKVKNG